MQKLYAMTALSVLLTEGGTPTRPGKLFAGRHAHHFPHASKNTGWESEASEMPTLTQDEDRSPTHH